MNVCFLLGRLHKNGGIGRVTTMLANALCKEEDLNVKLLCYSDRKQGVFYKIEPEIELSYLLNEHCNMKKAMLKGTHKKLREYLIKNDIDVLVACGVTFYPISVMAVRKTKTKCICWEHCNLLTTSDIDFEGICRRIGAKKADLILTLTKRDKSDYSKKFKKAKIDQVYNAVDPEIFVKETSYDPDTKKIISVGRLTYQKQFDVAVKVAALVLPKFPDYTWSIYGCGEDEEKLKGLIKEAGLENRLILEGQTSNIYDLYNKHSLLVMTSRYEGFPMVLLEGLGKNLPLVSFDVFTGPNEIIHNGENGYLIEPFNIEKMAEKICEILNDRDLRIKMSENCKNYIDEFKFSDIVKKWKEIFTKTLNS